MSEQYIRGDFISHRRSKHEPAYDSHGSAEGISRGKGDVEAFAEFARVSHVSVYAWKDSEATPYGCYSLAARWAVWEIAWLTHDKSET